LALRRGLIGLLAATAMSCAQAHTGLDRTPTANEKVPAPLIRSLNVGVPRDVLVELVPEPIDQSNADGGSDSGSSSDAGDIGSMTEGLARDLGGLPTHVARAMIDEDLEERAKYYEAAQEAITSELDESEVKVLTRYEHVPFLFVNVTTLRGLYALASRPEVLRLHEDKEYEHQLADSLSLINQPAVAASGRTGAGTAVAVLDTGADYTRADFGSCSEPGPACKVAFARDFAQNDSVADDNGHGTNVSAIVLGVAPSTKVLALDVFEANGLALSSSIIAAVDWSIANRTMYNIVAMNLSLGGGSYNKQCTTSPFASALANARAAGVVPIVASGNGALTGALAAPACVPAAVSVGAVYDANVGGLSYSGSGCSDRTTAANQVTCFSNSASFLSMLAPGAPITAGGFRMTGTSQAAPHVAGAYAVVRAAFPAEAVNASIARLTDSGASIRDARNGITKRRLDLQAALKGPTVRDNTPPTGSVAINANQATSMSRDVTLSITGNDANGVDSMCISNAGTCTSFESFATSKAWQLTTGDGLKTVRVALRDSAGNQGIVTDTIRLDTTGPTGATLRASAQNSAAALSWSAATDAGSGLSGYRLVVAEGNPPANCNEGSLIYNGNSRSFTHTGLTNGTTYGYRLCPTDMAGNVGAGSVASTRPAPELQPPTGSLKINGGTAFTGSDNVTLSFSATDASGVARMCISNNKSSCTSWESFSPSKVWALATQSGPTSVFVWFEDTFGNRTLNPVSANILVDSAPPLDVIIRVTAGQARVSVTWNGSDASGIQSYKLLFSPGMTPPSGCNTGTKLYEGPLRAYTHTNLTANASYSYRVCATDRAGNLSQGAVATISAR